MSLMDWALVSSGVMLAGYLALLVVVVAGINRDRRAIEASTEQLNARTQD